MVEVSSHVVFEGTTPGKAAATNLANKRFMIKVKSLMHDHIASLCEALLTQITFIPFDPSMNGHDVIFEI